MTLKQRLLRAAYDWQNQMNSGDITDAHLAAEHMANLVIAIAEQEAADNPKFSVGPTEDGPLWGSK